MLKTIIHLSCFGFGALYISISVFYRKINWGLMYYLVIQTTVWDQNGISITEALGKYSSHVCHLSKMA